MRVRRTAAARACIAAVIARAMLMPASSAHAQRASETAVAGETPHAGAHHPVHWNSALAPMRAPAERDLERAARARNDLETRWIDEQQHRRFTPSELASYHREFETVRALFATVTNRAPDLVAGWLGLAETADDLVQVDDAAARDDVEVTAIRDADAMTQASSDALAEALARVGDGAELAGILFRQGVIFTRMRRFGEARDAYERHRTLAVPTHARALALCNLAEIYTYLGEADRSIALYRDCIALRPDHSSGYWGLASACDRGGLVHDAQSAVASALAIDPALSGIVGPGVFYVPPYELFYYLALAYEGQGRLAEARDAWARYLARGGEHDPWAARARRHLADLTARPSRRHAP